MHNNMNGYVAGLTSQPFSTWLLEVNLVALNYMT
jgi:hypothetical protein